MTLTPADSRLLIFANVKEPEWQTTVRGWSDFGEWFAYATWSSIHSPSGYPDLTLAHKRRRLIAFIELKTMTGKLRTEQRHWQDVLGAAADFNPRIVVAVWRPHQGDLVRNFLVLDGIDPPPSCPEPVVMPRVRKRLVRRRVAR